MDNKVTEIKINEYVGEELSELSNIINVGNNLLIQAPTGSGKSTAIIQYAKANPHKRIAFLCPTRALVNNLSESESTKGIPCGFGHDFINQNKRSSVIISTYDSIRLLEGVEILVIDEAHLLAGHSGFREVLSDLLKFPEQTIMVSATPEIIEDLPNFRRINFIKKPEPKFIEVARSNQAHIQTAINILEDNNRDRSKLTIIRLNNKDTLQEVYNRLKPKYNRSIAMYYSSGILTEIQDERLIENLSRGVVPYEIEILLCTSIFDAGMSLQVSKEVNCFAISNNQYRMPNPIDMIQLQNRVRSTQGVMNLTIIGEFGEFTSKDITETKFTTNNKRIWLNFANAQYDLYRDLDMHGYFGLLDFYDIRADEIKQPSFIKKASSIGSNISGVEIAKNLTNFPEVYEGILELCRHTNNGDWLNVINGTKYISYYTIPAKVFEIRNELTKALKHDLHFSLFIDKAYHEKRVKELNKAVQEYNTSEYFRYVIDQLIKGAEVREGKTYKMPLQEYHSLNRNQQGMIKEVAKLLFNGRQWGAERKNITLKRLGHNKKVNNYISTFQNGVDDIWFELYRAV